MKRKIVCVLGMHRSGTSWLTGALQSSGLYAGDYNKINIDQEKGNRENQDIMSLNIALLSYSGGSWMNLPKDLKWSKKHIQVRNAIIESRFEESEVWVFKDPRTLVTLPFWEEKIEYLEYVGIFRHPLSVAISLYRRGNCSLIDGLKLWIEYNKLLLAKTLKYRFPIIIFDENAGDLQQSLDIIFDHLSQVLPGEHYLQRENAQQFFVDKAVHNSNVDFYIDDQTSTDAIELISKAKLLFEQLCCLLPIGLNERIVNSTKIPIEFEEYQLINASATQTGSRLLTQLLMQFYTQNENFIAAIKCGQIYSNNHDDDVDVMWEIGLTYIKAFDFSKGVENLKGAVVNGKRVDNQELLALHAILNSEDGSDCFIELINWFVQENAVSKQRAREYLILGHFKLKQFSEVVSLFKESGQRYIRNFEIELRAAISMYRLGMVKGSEEILLKLDNSYHGTESHVIWNILGEIYKSTGVYDKAMNYFTKAAISKPHNHAFQVKLGLVAKQMGEISLAALHFSAALKLEPEIPRVKKELANLKNLKTDKKGD